jgi:hypothetical protein
MSMVTVASTLSDGEAQNAKAAKKTRRKFLIEMKKERGENLNEE